MSGVLKKKRPALLRASEKARQVAANGKVGKGSPPEAFKWRPGQSGNPSGLPSAHREVIVASVKAMLAQVDPKLNKSLFERLLEQCARRALQGSKWHMGVLLDYGLGKPTQALEHSGGINLTDIILKARQREQAPLQATTHSSSDVQAPPAATDAPEQDMVREDAEEQTAIKHVRPRRIVVM